MKGPKFDAFVAACDFPGVLDQSAVEHSLSRYLAAIGEKREIVRLPAGWRLADFPTLDTYVDEVLKEFDARAALAALAAKSNASKERFAKWCIQSYGWGYWKFDLSWISTTYFGATTTPVNAWSEPLLDAYIAGCWMLHWTKDTLFWVAKPRVHTIPTQSGRSLHRTDGPALESDIEPLFFLNGVLMEEHHVTTPAEKLNPSDCIKEVNVEVRRELIRKMGVELMLSHLPHKSLDKRGDYELLRIDFPDLVDDTRYLKMLNPSIGVWHLEGVTRECNTVQQAINWRAGKFAEREDWLPAQLT